jgi:hypothetical protein
MQEIYKVKNLILVLRKNLRNYHLNLELEWLVFIKSIRKEDLNIIVNQ